MKYTKKPVTIEAVKWNGTGFDDGPEQAPWVQEALNKLAYLPGAVWEKTRPVTDKTLPSLLVRTLHGCAEVKPGDYLVKTINGDLYPCDGVLFHQIHSQGASNLQQLDELQNKVGYVRGDINIIALLGLFGEAGEVLGELFLIDNSEDDLKAEDLKMLAVDTAKKIDNLKKAIRDNKNSDKINIGTNYVVSSDDFDKELADCFYYLNALAINRGLTLEDLAGISVAKVKTKQQQNISHGSITNCN
jgi:hypothetical protein